MELKDIALTWLELQSLLENSPEAKALIWAKDSLMELAVSSPQICWRVLLEILENTDSSNILKKIAEGPLEVLLILHTHSIIHSIKQELNQNHNLQKTMGFVCPVFIPMDVQNSFHPYLKKHSD